MKRIQVNGLYFLIEKSGNNWVYRINDLLIIKPTIKELKNDICNELKNKK